MPELSNCEFISGFPDFISRASINLNLLLSGHRARTVVASNNFFLSILLILCFSCRCFLIEPLWVCILNLSCIYTYCELELLFEIFVPPIFLCKSSHFYVNPNFWLVFHLQLPENKLEFIIHQLRDSELSWKKSIRNKHTKCGIVLLTSLPSKLMKDIFRSFSFY